MNFKRNFLLHYLSHAPIALAVERFLECEILSQCEFVHPVLDIGCGEGLFAHILFDEKIDIGIDCNQRELERAKSYDAYTQLIQVRGDNLPVEDNSINTLLSNSVLEHIPEYGPVLKEARRVLTDAGRFYLTVPTEKFDQYTMIFQLLSFLKMHRLAKKYQDFFNGFWKHFHFYDIKEWRDIFEKYGFTVCQTIEYNTKCIGVLNDFLVPFAIGGFLTKKCFNKWSFFPRVRIIYMFPFYLFFRLVIMVTENRKNGGIVFFQLQKNTSCDNNE